jgi:hypothetical protein
VDIVLDIKVRPPVADLRGASQSLDGQHGESELIADGDLLLVLLNESGIRRGRKIMEWPIRDSTPSIAFGRDTARREGDAS